MKFWRQWRRLVLSAVKLNQLFLTINVFKMKKAHNNDQKDHTETTLAIFALLLKNAIFGYRPLPPFSLIPSTDLKDGYCNFMASYVWNIDFFFAI